MGVPSTKGSWQRKVQNKALHELGKQILHEKDPERRRELERRWHRLKNEQHWKEALESRGSYEPLDYDELPQKTGGLK